jgi:hypothetical protein
MFESGFVTISLIVEIVVVQSFLFVPFTLDYLFANLPLLNVAFGKRKFSCMKGSARDCDEDCQWGAENKPVHCVHLGEARRAPACDWRMFQRVRSKKDIPRVMRGDIFGTISFGMLLPTTTCGGDLGFGSCE